MINHSTIAITGLAGATRQRFLSAPTGAGAALAAQLMAALAGASAPDSLDGNPDCRLPELPGAAAPAVQNAGAVLCDEPGLLWALEAIAAALPDTLFVVCYEAPWRAFEVLLGQAPERFLAAPRVALDLWRRYYREALRLRTMLGARMLFINTQFTGGWDGQLLDYLQDRGVVLERAVPEPGEAARPAAWDLARAHVLDVAAPEYWDLYEALEGCALLLGRAPAYRQTLGVPTDACADALFEQWGAPHAQRRAQADLLAARSALLAQRAHAGGSEQREGALQAALDGALRRADGLEADLASEREHLMALRDALHDQAQDWAIQCRAIEQAAQDSALGAAAAAGLASNAAAAELASVLDCLRAATAGLAECRSAGQDAQAAARAELDCLLETLHATQERLEQSYAESDALAATATRANALLRQAWLLVARAQRPATERFPESSP